MKKSIFLLKKRESEQELNRNRNESQPERTGTDRTGTEPEPNHGNPEIILGPKPIGVGFPRPPWDPWAPLWEDPKGGALEAPTTNGSTLGDTARFF